MTKKYNILIEKDEDGYYVSEVLDLPGCHTQAKTIDVLIERTKEAIKAYLEVETQTDYPLEFVRVQEIEV
ncbi:MAG TPA: type II toxin-antitoxin system HicB family antitoxin [Methanofastidiosum sp.]|jgi:predicted RNase H-like HicB family nuclease|nr:type II toxin-antitoxin system HicB family antitoxin [Methanofastidiosum sp.]HNU60913.1 type II toxin-antitoxin system HicB family antitoxin [Methanofastidiosum sp.]